MAKNPNQESISKDPNARVQSVFEALPQEQFSTNSEISLAAKDLLEQKIIDRIVLEPLGGAHKDHKLMAVTLKQALKEELEIQLKIKPEKLVNNRLEKFGKMGVFVE